MQNSISDKIYVKIIAGILVSVLVACNFNEENSDISTYDLEGSVKSIHVIAYNAIEKFGEVEKDRRIQIPFIKMGNNELNNSEFYLEFDSKGRHKLRKIFFHPDVINSVSKWEYNGELLTKFEHESLSNNGELLRKTIWLYDYDEDEIEMSTYNSDGSLNYRETVSIKDREKNRSKNITETIDSTATYDNNGNVIEEKIYNDQGEYIKTITREFNSKDQLVIEKEKYEGYEPDVTKYSYNEYGDLVERISDNKSLARSFDFIEEGTNITNYRIEYDTKGNWIKKIEFYNDNPEWIVIRHIEYF